VLFLGRGTDILSSFILFAAGNCPCRLSFRKPCRVPAVGQSLCVPWTSHTFKQCLKAVLFESKRRVVGPLCMHVLILVSRVCCCHFPAAWLPTQSHISLDSTWLTPACLNALIKPNPNSDPALRRRLTHTVEVPVTGTASAWWGHCMNANWAFTYQNHAAPPPPPPNHQRLGGTTVTFT